jgi:hypothetical protein
MIWEGFCSYQGANGLTLIPMDRGLGLHTLRRPSHASRRPTVLDWTIANLDRRKTTGRKY